MTDGPGTDDWRMTRAEVFLNWDKHCERFYEEMAEYAGDDPDRLQDVIDIMHVHVGPVVTQGFKRYMGL